jgi:hypothetical protein
MELSASAALLGSQAGRVQSEALQLKNDAPTTPLTNRASPLPTAWIAWPITTHIMLANENYTQHIDIIDQSSFSEPNVALYRTEFVLTLHLSSDQSS